MNSKAERDIEAGHVKGFPEGFDRLSRRQQRLLFSKAISRFGRSSYIPWLVMLHFVIHSIAISLAWGGVAGRESEVNLFALLLAVVVASAACFLPLRRCAVLHSWSCLQREIAESLESDVDAVGRSAPYQSSSKK